jgi:hypothetical protein
MDYTVRIVDVAGRLLHQCRDTGTSQYDVSFLSRYGAGVYTLVVQRGIESITRRIVVQ